MAVRREKLRSPLRVVITSTNEAWEGVAPGRRGHKECFALKPLTASRLDSMTASFDLVATAFGVGYKIRVKRKGSCGLMRVVLGAARPLRFFPCSKE
jgi:hypothetical protein